MSEATERATRRYLRRAVGTEAVSIIEQQGVALAHHAFVLNQHTQQLHEVQKRIDALALASAHDGARMTAFHDMSFMARLRWLFLGR